MSNDTEYTVQTYGTHKVYILEGMYSIEEVENLLSGMKKVKQIQKDMLLQATADSARTAKAPPTLLSNKGAYELGRLHGAAAEREECAKVVEIIASMVVEGTVVHNFLVASAAKIRARLKA